MVKVSIENFRCYAAPPRRVFDFPEGKITRLAGNSGDGKSTILMAIRWCLYGSSLFKGDALKPVVGSSSSVPPLSKKPTKVSVETSRYIFTRVSAATASLTVIDRVSSTRVSASGADAEAIVSRVFGASEDVFMASSYLAQGERSPILTLKNADLFGLMRDLTFGTDTAPVDLMSRAVMAFNDARKARAVAEARLAAARTMAEAYPQLPHRGDDTAAASAVSLPELKADLERTLELKGRVVMSAASPVDARIRLADAEKRLADAKSSCCLPGGGGDVVPEHVLEDALSSGFLDAYRVARFPRIPAATRGNNLKHSLYAAAVRLTGVSSVDAIRVAKWRAHEASAPDGYTATCPSCQTAFKPQCVSDAAASGEAGRGATTAPPHDGFAWMFSVASQGGDDGCSAMTDWLVACAKARPRELRALVETHFAVFEAVAAYADVILAATAAASWPLSDSVVFPLTYTPEDVAAATEEVTSLRKEVARLDMAVSSSEGLRIVAKINRLKREICTSEAAKEHASAAKAAAMLADAERSFAEADAALATAVAAREAVSTATEAEISHTVKRIESIANCCLDAFFPAGDCLSVSFVMTSKPTITVGGIASNMAVKINFSRGKETSWKLLSGGETDRLSMALTTAVATFMATSHKKGGSGTGEQLFLMDECMASLSQNARDDCFDAIGNILPAGTTVVNICHDVSSGCHDGEVAL